MWNLLKSKFASWLLRKQLASIVAWLASVGVDLDKAAPAAQGGVTFPLISRLWSFFMAHSVQTAQQLQGMQEALRASHEQFEDLYRETFPLLSAELQAKWEAKVGKPLPPSVAGGGSGV